MKKKMSLNEWKKQMLEKTYYDLKRDQVIRAAVRSLLTCRVQKFSDVAGDIRTATDQFDEVLKALADRKSSDPETQFKVTENRQGPVEQMSRAIERLIAAAEQLEELVEQESRVLREITMEEERIAKEVEKISQRIAEEGDVG